MSIDHSHWAFELMVRTPTSSVLLDRVKVACVPGSSRTNEWVARFLTTCHESLLKFDFRHCKQIQLKQLLYFSSSLILVSNFSILTSKLRNLCVKPPLTGVAHGSLSLASNPLSGSSLPYSPTLDKVIFPSQGRVLFRVETWASVPLCLWKKTKPIKIRTSKWLINIPRCAINRSNYLRVVFHLLLAKPIKILIKNNLLFNIGPFIFLLHTKGNPIKECNLLHIMLTFTRIEIKSCQVTVRKLEKLGWRNSLGSGRQEVKGQTLPGLLICLAKMYLFSWCILIQSVALESPGIWPESTWSLLTLTWCPPAYAEYANSCKLNSTYNGSVVQTILNWFKSLF